MKATEKEFQTALTTHVLASSLHHEFVRASEEKDESRAESHANAIRRIVPPGLYEHFKSESGKPMFYIVNGVLFDVDLYSASVSYASLYGKKAGISDSRRLLHKARIRLSDKDCGFLTPVDRPSHPYRGPRFKFVQELSLRQIADILDYVGELKMKKDPVEVRMFIGEILKKKVPMF